MRFQALIVPAVRLLLVDISPTLTLLSILVQKGTIDNHFVHCFHPFKLKYRVWRTYFVSTILQTWQPLLNKSKDGFLHDERIIASSELVVISSTFYDSSLLMLLMLLSINWGTSPSFLKVSSSSLITHCTSLFTYSELKVRVHLLKFIKNFPIDIDFSKTEKQYIENCTALLWH